jgi:hypothetical protein
MNSGNGSYNTHSELEPPSGPAIHAQTNIFKVTPEDVNILNEYIVEFEEANTGARHTLLEKILGALYALHPPNTVFDKSDIKEACDLNIHI